MQTTPAITVNLEGRDLPLRFEYRDFARAEAKLGQPILSRFKELSGLPAHLLTLLLYTGTLNADKSMTLEKAESLITFENASEIEAAVSRAVEESFPKPKEGAEEGSPLAPMSSGIGSGPSPDSISESPNATSGD